MKRKRGFALIEVIAVISVLVIVVALSMNFFSFNNRLYWRLSNSVDKKANVRIGMEFITSKIRQCKAIEWDSVRLRWKIDGSPIYIKDNIIRYDTDSQQIVNNITSFSIRGEDISKGLYRVTIISGEYSMSSLIKIRGE